MIKENDLRLNNLVKWNDSVQKITAIAFGNCLLNKNPTADYPVKIIEIEPIKLTEKILLSCGFKKRKSCFGYWIYEIMFKHTVFSVEEVDLGLCYFYVENTHVSQTRYVHELQNLYFFITGEELVFSLTAT